MQFVAYKIARLAAVSALLGLAACQTSVDEGSTADVAVTDVGVKAFRDVCLNSAPDFATAETNARSYGISKLEDTGIGKTAFTADGSLSVQVKPGRECAITTENRSGNGVRAQFLKVVAEAGGSSASGSVPFVATVNGSTFIFQHDRNGGEAYVMLKK